MHHHQVTTQVPLMTIKSYYLMRKAQPQSQFLKKQSLTKNSLQIREKELKALRRRLINDNLRKLLHLDLIKTDQLKLSTNGKKWF